MLITTNDVIQTINRDYRDKDAVTDVISFAYNETENIGPMNILGDIVISLDRVKEQARNMAILMKGNFTMFFCHGLLHLLGYDHSN